MCTTYQCERRISCKRYISKPDPYRQAYSDFGPDEDGVCDGYWPTQKQISVETLIVIDERNKR